MSQIMIEAIIIMAVGVVGSVLPLIPGPPIVWLGALYYGWRTGWVEVGWPSLTLLLVLAIIGGTADLWMGYLGASKGGASGWATLASMIGGIVGLLVLSLPGAIIGSVGAIVLVEYGRHRDWRKVARASGGYLVGSLLATVVQVIICLVMIGVFAAAVSI
ncbi:MAG: DUF456 domain-containing protein [Chloroflexota bacterium]|nr:DUF456 domain-containing protein [Chloroflexota bacterium]